MRKLIAEIRNRTAQVRRKGRLFGRREDGSVAIEYVVLGPIYMMLLLGIFEIAAISMSMTSVRVGLDNVGRLVRTGQAQCVSDDDVKEIVCRNSIGTSCESSFSVERSVYSSGAGADAVSVNDWQSLNADDIVLITAGYDWPLMVPLRDPFLGRGQGSVPIQSAVVFKSETYANVTCN